MNLAKYFNDEQYKANASGSYMNANGDWDFNQDQYLAQGAESMGVSKPIKLKIVNTTTTAIANLVIFNANAAIGLGAGGTTSGVTFTIVNSADGLYSTLLGEIMVKPFRVGKTQLISSTSNQLNESLTVEYKNADGRDYREVLDIELSEMQQQTDRVSNKEEYDINGSTKITLSSLLASATLYINFYPRQIRNTGVFNKSVDQSFSAPKTIVPVMARG